MTHDEQILKLREHVLKLAECIRLLTRKDDEPVNTICIDVIDELSAWDLGDDWN